VKENSIFTEVFWEVSRSSTRKVKEQVQKDIMGAVAFRLAHQTSVKVSGFLLEEDIRELVKYQVTLGLP